MSRQIARKCERDALRGLRLCLATNGSCPKLDCLGLCAERAHWCGKSARRKVNCIQVQIARSKRENSEIEITCGRDPQRLRSARSVGRRVQLPHAHSCLRLHPFPLTPPALGLRVFNVSVLRILFAPHLMPFTCRMDDDDSYLYGEPAEPEPLKPAAVETSGESLVIGKRSGVHYSHIFLVLHS